MNSANKNAAAKTPARYIPNNMIVNRSSTKPSSGNVCRTINFVQTLRENNISNNNNNNKLLNNRSPAVTCSNATRTVRPLSQANDTNTAVNIIKHYRANITRNSARLQNNNLQGRRPDGQRDCRNTIDKNSNKQEISPSKLTTILNTTNMLNETTNEKKSNDHLINEVIVDSESSDRSARLARLTRHNELNAKQTAIKQLNNSNNQLNNLKTPIKPIKQYPDIVSPSLIKPPTAQVIRHEPNRTHSPLQNQAVFNYPNLNIDKYYNDEDHCVSESTHKLLTNKYKNQQQSIDKVYTEQTLSASCNRLSQVPTNSNQNLPAAVASASSTPSLINNGLNSAAILFPHSIVRNYEIGDLIGEGNFAVVHQCMHKRTRRRYALKVIDKRKCAGKEAMIENEVSILRKIKHPNIVQLHEDYDYTNELYLVMELVYGGDLFDGIAQVTKYNEKEAQNLIRDLITAIHHLHILKICHRDIKPENLLLTTHDLNFIGDDKPGVRLKLADFGLAVEMKDDEPKLYTVCGTMFYISPEQLLANHGYDLKVDIWAAGVIMFIVLSGYAPFSSETNDIDELFDQILSGKVDFNEDYWNDISLEAKDLILMMLNVDIDRRFTAEQVMNHAWIKNDIRTFSYDSSSRQVSPLDGYEHYHAYLSEGSNLSLYEEEALNSSNNSKIHHHTESGYSHLNYNGQSNKNNQPSTNSNFNQMTIDHRDDQNGSELTNTNGSRINNSHHPLLKNPPSDGSNSNSNTLIDSDVSNSSNSFASG